MVYNGILMETIVISVMVSIGLLLFVCFSRVHICNSPGSTLPQLVGAGLKLGIPVREAGALTSNAKGYSL